MPAGVIMAYAGTTAPLGFLFCDGSAVSRTGYASLYTAISGTFGIGDGSTTFNLPDLRGRTIIGLGTNASVNALALSDGVAVANRRPQHRHTPHFHTFGYNSAALANGSNQPGTSNPGTAQVTSTVDGGSGVSTDSLDAPAFLVTNYIISTTTVAPVVASTTNAYGGSIASGSSIVVTGNSTYLLTGTTALSTVTGGVTGNLLTILASGQATGVCVVLNNGTTSNALSLRDSANLGIYAGESVTFMYNGTYWVETTRNLKTILDYVQITSPAAISATSQATATTLITGNAVTYDGATPIYIEAFAPSIDYGTNYGATSQVHAFLDGSVLCVLQLNQWAGAGSTGPHDSVMYALRKYTPSAGSHTFSLRGHYTGNASNLNAGTGASGAQTPAFLSIKRAI
jgi:microcystin-dependent protein